ncbi:metallophosphoesterase [Promicromonospora iranensis]|uniref:Calcineurin-like phosphoesterase family protein n=1 Tax=Promicromonospora iranensis TaxID=1105144 RepID=A0ABU2CVB4_9MICO|nr:metallophosphoesterase [Promicromonospora iranensis]MDR7385280.1 calcineurin-like phosphoesterase family protein [Promicromonospora iranensis]
MTTYYTSDQHFGHLNIIRFCDRPFPGAPAMNARLVELWNETVSDDDTVWVLGDVALGALDESLAHVDRLAGRKILVPGNHDRCWEGERTLRKGEPEARERRRTKERQRYLDAGFAEIHDRPDPVAVGGQNVVLSHFPFEGDSHGEDRFVEYRPVDRGSWVVHGHVHNTWRQRGRQINVGVDAWGGRPVPAAAIAALLADGPRDLEPLSWERPEP